MPKGRKRSEFYFDENIIKEFFQDTNYLDDSAYSAATGEWRGSKNGWPGGQYPQNIYTREPNLESRTKKSTLTVSMYVFERF